MKVVVTKNSKIASQYGAKLFEQAYKNGAKVFGLATGGTSEELYRDLCQSDLDFKDCISINLDEYVGLADNHSESYHYYMQKNLFDKKPFLHSYLPNGMATSTSEECERYDLILSNNPVDLQLLGIGENGHIGFNEPKTPFTSTTHVVQLTQSTIEANSRFFKDKSQVPTKAITQGISNILQAKQIILLAFGLKKAQAVKNAILGPITEQVPASVLQTHPNVVVILDESAASQLPKDWQKRHVDYV